MEAHIANLLGHLEQQIIAEANEKSSKYGELEKLASAASVQDEQKSVPAATSLHPFLVSVAETEAETVKSASAFTGDAASPWFHFDSSS